VTITWQRRVYVRAPLASDEREFISLMRASRSFHRPWASAPTDPHRFAAYVADAQRADFEALLVCRTEDDAIVGFFNLSQIVRGPVSSASLGYAVGKRYAGRGYMREGLELVLKIAFEDLGLDLIEANIQPGNRASIALARGAGFVRETGPPRYLKISGQWRDHDRWVLSGERWRALRREE
jgi:ribosomal-protein-alanine N-acetyltransferase